MKRLLLFCSLLLVFLPACGPAGKQAKRPVMSVTDDGASLILMQAEHPILSYNYAVTPVPKGVRPIFARSGYIHPLHTPSGFVLTAIQPRDHRHHYGLWNPWTRVEYDGKVYDLWNLGDSLGTVRARQVDAVYEGDTMCGFDATLDHVAFTPGGETVILNELWQVRARQTPEGYQLDFTSVYKPATDKPVIIKAYRYQGFSIRANESWTRDNCSMRTSEGLERPQIDASRAHWIYVNGQTGPDTTGGFLFLASPDNYNTPEPLRIWNEAANGGRGDVFVNFCPTKTQDWRMEPGGEYRLRYRVVTYDGAMDAAVAERLWNEYIQQKTK